MERRKHPRSGAAVLVRIEVDGAEYRGVARDISTRGAFVLLEEPTSRLARDRRVDMHFEIDTGAQVLSREIAATVVRSDEGGSALRFAEQDILARAVVHELMYYLQLCRGRALPAGGCTHDRTRPPTDGRAA